MSLDGKNGSSLKKKGLWFVAVLLAVAFGVVLYRDLSLVVPLPSSPQGGESHMEIEEIDMERLFEGDRWHLTAPLTVREGEETLIMSADINVVTASGDTWVLRSPRVHFDEAMEKGHLKLPEGTVEGAGFTYQWKAGKADWDGLERVWSLSGGFHVEGKTYVMEARSGTIFPAGMVRLEEEVTVRWRSDTLNN